MYQRDPDQRRPSDYLRGSSGGLNIWPIALAILVVFVGALLLFGRAGTGPDGRVSTHTETPTTTSPPSTKTTPANPPAKTP